MNSQKRKWKENIEMILQTNDHVTFIKSIIRNASEEGRCVNEIESEEIALKLGVSRRALYGIKPNAYFRIAIWSHQVAYIKENTYEFIFNYAGLYERLK